MNIRGAAALVLGVLAAVTNAAGPTVDWPQWRGPARTGIAGARVLGFSHRQKGQVVALDAATGRLLWAGPGRQGENASLIVAGGDALVLTTEGELLVLKADADRFAPEATYGVGDSATWSHLALAPNAVLIKDVRTLALWRVP